MEKGKFYLFILEDGHWLPVWERDPKGGRNYPGYATFEEAKAGALKRVDDALVRNTVQVMQYHGHAYYGGDGGSYFSDEEQA